MTESVQTTVDDLEEVFEPEAPAEFRIDSDERAEWLLGTLADLDAREERIKANAADIVSGIRRRREGLLRRFGRELEDYCRRKCDGRGRTVKFLNGRVNWRRIPGGPRLTDETAALEFLDSRDELFERCVTVTAKVRAADYIAIVEETGELLPGIEVVPEQEACYINGHRLDRALAAGEEECL